MTPHEKSELISTLLTAMTHVNSAWDRVDPDDVARSLELCREKIRAALAIARAA